MLRRHCLLMIEISPSPRMFDALPRCFAHVYAIIFRALCHMMRCRHSLMLRRLRRDDFDAISAITPIIFR